MKNRGGWTPEQVCGDVKTEVSVRGMIAEMKASKGAGGGDGRGVEIGGGGRGGGGNLVGGGGGERPGTSSGNNSNSNRRPVGIRMVSAEKMVGGRAGGRRRRGVWDVWIWG